MTEAELHVVFGTGQVGSALATHLTGLGLAVRAVSRHRPAALPGGVDWRAADVTDAEAAVGAAKGASAVYQCLNAPYTHTPIHPYLFSHHFLNRINDFFHIRFAEIITIAGICRSVCFCSQCSGSNIQPAVTTLLFHHFIK